MNISNTLLNQKLQQKEVFESLKLRLRPEMYHPVLSCSVLSISRACRYSNANYTKLLLDSIISMGIENVQLD